MPVKTKNADWADVPSIYSGMDFTDEDMDWNISFIDLPVSEFLTGAEELEYYSSPLTDQTLTSKYQIRHHDCMWSGRCGSHPEKSKCNQKHSNINHNNNNNSNQSQQHTKTTATVPLTNLTGVSPTQICQMKQQIQQQQQIPAGRSLLRQNQLKPIRMPVIQQTDFSSREREIIARPDTPLSLDDDPPEFKHSIDLAACTVGSNNMSLVTDETDSITAINKIKELLEDSSTQSSIVQQRKIEPESLSDILKDMETLSDFEDLDDNDDRDSAVDMDSDSESGGNTTTESSMSSQSTAYEYQATHVGDHSYTRCKNRVDTVGLGVQTPSDSEEEIDVVSVGDKTLPTNPSARDRRALQTTVAHKISARMVKPARQTGGGLKTIPPRRRCSEDSILASSCSSTPTKVSNSPNYDMHMMSSSASSISSSSRKRSKQSNGESGSSSKRHRGKKQRSPGKRQHSDSDEADTIEKRNLHNDMERQRRIGLKNLFEELKYQIPSIRDKERAPKVSILREAASLCNKLNREQEQMTALKKQQQRLLARVKTLRTSLAHQWG